MGLTCRSSSDDLAKSLLKFAGMDMEDLKSLVMRACSGDLDAYGKIVRRFFLCLEEDLMKRVAETLRDRRGLILQDDMVLEDRRISRVIERAQEEVEQRHFEIRCKLDRLEADRAHDADHSKRGTPKKLRPDRAH